MIYFAKVVLHPSQMWKLRVISTLPGLGNLFATKSVVTWMEITVFIFIRNSYL